MQNSFFTPQEIHCRKKQPYKLSLIDSYDFTLLNQDLFQLVSPHVQSISDQKRKIISWLKRTPLLQRTDILTYTNKQFVCMIRSMYEKKQASYYDDSSINFTISYIEMTDEFDLLVMVNNKKLSNEYYDAEDELLGNIRVMSRYTQFDSVTFSEEFVRNVDVVFNLFDVLGDGIAHELTVKDFERLNKLPNSVMFYDPSQEHCYKKARIGTWITQVFMKHISMKYLQHSLHNSPQTLHSSNELKQRTRQFQKYWKLITPQRKNEIIKKVLLLKPIDLYQQHRSMIKVTRNGFPPIQKSDKIPQLIKSILTCSDKDIFDVLFYSNLNQTLESHSILKYYITLQLEDEIKRFYQLQDVLAKDNKMKKRKKKTKNHSNNNHQHALQYEKQPLLGNKHAQEITNCNIHSSNQNKKYENSISNHKISPTQQIKQIKVNQSEREINTKGNDLFYKKLEVSQTIQIISFQSNITNTLSVQRDQKCCQKKSSQVVKEVKEEEKQTKKKRKNKKKNQNKIVGEQIKNEQAYENNQTSNTTSILLPPTKNTAQQSSQAQQQPPTTTNQPILMTDTLTQQKTIHFLYSQTQKFHHMDKISQKSSETTNDYSEELKLQSSDNDQQKQVREGYNNCMGELMKQLQKKISFYNKQRKIILNRLSYVFAQHQLSFKLYGSSSHNTSLPSSDIDIVVDPSIVNYFYFSYSNYRNKIINSLEYLQKVFEKHDWTSDFTLISGATIPLLTFTANPCVEFELEHGTLYNNKKELKQQVKINVDVTIETYVNMTDQIPLHLGVETSQLVKQWIACFPFYTDLLILIKIFTKNHNLNKTYHGGISSFMHAVLLAGFCKRFFSNLSAQSQQLEGKRQRLIDAGFHLTQMFIEYCKFIIQFNEEKQIIDVNSNLSTCLKPPNIPSQQLTIINPLTGNVMSERCTSFPVYKKLIQQVYDVLTTKKQIQIKQYIQIVFDQ